VSQFFGIARHEFNMSIRRPGMWIAYGLLCLFYGVAVLVPGFEGSNKILLPDEVRREAGRLLLTFNVFMPLLAGILSADRIQRDFRNGVRELQNSTPVRITVYILAKYLGVLLSVLMPMFVWTLLIGLIIVATGQAPPSYIWFLLLAFLTMGVPAHAFVVAFSLACPLAMPLRVYQVLFTGYWFWGNFLSPQVFPTISDTLLNAAGLYSLQAFFGVYFSSPNATVTNLTTTTQAFLNILVLAACITAVLFTLNRYLRWQARRA
jgi:ABC-2 type transport system permease protein